MAKQNKNPALNAALDILNKMELDLKRTKLLLSKYISGDDGDLDTNNINSLDSLLWGLNTNSEESNNEITIVEWVFDGYFMLGTDKKKYPVPMNYSSKTKLIPGDVLKLRIMNDGKLIYKLISQANKNYVKASLSRSDDNKFTAITDEGKVYFLNQAAVSYYKGKTGDELSIIVNADGIGDFAAVEAVISGS